MFKVIVAGCRDFTNYELVKKSLNRILSNKHEIEIVSGRCDRGVLTFTSPTGIKVFGADGLGERYASENGISVKAFPANWKLGKSAGPRRNKQMSDYADALIAFWDGKSTGTYDMIEKASSKNLIIRIIYF